MFVSVYRYAGNTDMVGAYTLSMQCGQLSYPLVDVMGNLVWDF